MTTSTMVVPIKSYAEMTAPIRGRTRRRDFEYRVSKEESVFVVDNIVHHDDGTMTVKTRVFYRWSCLILDDWLFKNGRPFSMDTFEALMGDLAGATIEVSSEKETVDDPQKDIPKGWH